MDHLPSDIPRSGLECSTSSTALQDKLWLKAAQSLGTLRCSSEGLQPGSRVEERACSSLQRRDLTALSDLRDCPYRDPVLTLKASCILPLPYAPLDKFLAQSDMLQDWELEPLPPSLSLSIYQYELQRLMVCRKRKHALVSPCFFYAFSSSFFKILFYSLYSLCTKKHETFYT